MKKLGLILFLVSILSLGINKANCLIKVNKSGKGTPVIFLPSLGCTGEIWNNTVENLKDKYECHVVEIAGFGDNIIEGSLDFDKVKTEIVDYIKKNKLNKPILIGHSFGGILSMSIACFKPDIFSKMIIVDTYSCPLSIFLPTADKEQLLVQAEAVKYKTLGLSEEEFKKEQELTMTIAVSDNKISDKILNWVLNSKREVIAQAYYEMFSSDYRTLLGKLKFPVLVIGTWEGAQSYGFTKEEVADIFNEQYKNLEDCSILLADTGKHFIMYDNTEWFNEQIAKFLN